MQLKSSLFSIGLLASALPAALAQSVVVPNAFATTRGTGGLNTLTRDLNQPRTYMIGLSASELAGIPVGEVINGVSYRSSITASNAASWPAVDATWANYDIQIGPAIPLASWTGTFASNFASPPQTVRSGPMVITASSFTNNTSLPSPTPNAFAEFYWDFQTPYVYTGGDLAIYYTHTGSSIVGGYFLDVITSAAASGIVAYSQSLYQGTAGALATACITRVHYGYGAGCPGASGTAPNLVLSGNTPPGGGTVYVSVGNGPANQAGSFLFGLGRTSVPIVGACNLLTIPTITSPFSLDANGRFQLSQLIAPGVIGTLNAQVVVLDAGAPTVVTFSNGIEFTAL